MSVSARSCGSVCGGQACVYAYKSNLLFSVSCLDMSMRESTEEEHIQAEERAMTKADRTVPRAFTLTEAGEKSQREREKERGSL